MLWYFPGCRPLEAQLESANESFSCHWIYLAHLDLNKCSLNTICFQSKGMGLGKYTNHNSGKFIKQFILKLSYYALKFPERGNLLPMETACAIFCQL